MTLTPLDWSIVVLFLTLAIVIGLWASRSAGQNEEAYFLSGRRMPWWLLGVSMVATTFAADTPLLVTDIVRSNGVAGNWVWWAFLLTGMLTTFVYARLWRRSGVLTNLEFYELRYSGRAAVAVRSFRAVYLGLFFNVMIMATVTLAAIKISTAMLGITPLETVMVAGTATLIFCTLGGFLGVLLSDLVLFSAAMIGSIAAAIYALDHPAVNGLSGLLSHPQVVGKTSFLPDFSQPEQAMMIFILPLAVQWWNVWYPGSEPGGGGYVAQRMLAAKDEKNAMAAVLLFQCAHYVLRPWPWIIVALASLIVYPDLASLQEALPDAPTSIISHDLAYPAMLGLLPSGLKGLVVGSLLAAYMSTMSTQINWGSSYLVNDCYRRLLRPHASGRHLVLVGRIASAVLMVCACVLALFLESAMQAFTLLLSVGAGTGLLFILRWFWWRVNAWSEITAMLVSFLAAAYFQLAELPAMEAWQKVVVPIGITTLAWLLVTYATPSTEKSVLLSFCNLVKPAGPGWKPIKALAGYKKGLDSDNGQLALSLLSVLVASVSIYAALFAVGYGLYGRHSMATGLGAIALCGAGFMWKNWAQLTRA